MKDLKFIGRIGAVKRQIYQTKHYIQNMELSPNEFGLNFTWVNTYKRQSIIRTENRRKNMSGWLTTKIRIAIITNNQKKQLKESSKNQYLHD